MASFLSTVRPGHYNVSIRAKPGARTSAFAAPASIADDALEVRVAAPPVEGQANAELVDFMQSTLEFYAREFKSVKSSVPKGSACADSDALKPFFAGTAYEELLTAAEQAEDTKARGASAHEGSATNTAKKGKKQKASGKTATDGSSGSRSGGPDSSNLPEKVSVSLSRGSTSRSKMLEVAFPGSDIELACVLQLASRDAK